MLKISQLACGLALTAALAGGAANAQAAFTGPRTDFRDETIYFVMTSRFYDGDKSNNTYCWDGKLNVDDPEWRGDFKGLIEKLDYLKALGFTAVWITPVVENASGLDYHGYHAINFDKVDPRNESEDVDFQKVIDECHKRGMKLVLDVVLQHTGNFGEEKLCPMFVKDYTQPLSNIEKSMKLHPNTGLPSNYNSLIPGLQYDARINLMKNINGKGGDPNNYWHHVGQAWDWDDPTRWWGQIAGDCVDLNTENPTVYNYIIDSYSKFIAMGVDGFRIDTSGHISRLTFNKAFIPAFQKAAEKAKAKRGGTPFYMFGEVCAVSEEVIYRGQNYNCSPCFYTWAETNNYEWSDDASDWAGKNYSECNPNAYANTVNGASVLAQAKDYLGHSESILQRSKNAFLSGNSYHTPDYSKSSGFNVIDFPMHQRYHHAENAFGVRSDDDLYNDATWNVVYVDSHDYGPNGYKVNAFDASEDVWAENLSLMFTWRGIPCVFQGTETRFRRTGGYVIDKGADAALKNTLRAYYGGYLTGDVKATDFGEFTATGNAAASLSHPLAQHLRRLNKIRAAVPALRKGQYSTEGCSGKMAFKRRFTEGNVDSYVLVTVSGDATFTGVLNGKYVDAITGDVQNVTSGTLNAKCSGQGNMRVYVLNGPGKIGDDGKFLYASSPASVEQKAYDGQEEAGDTETIKDTPQGGGGGGGGGQVEEPEVPIEPSMTEGEQAVFFEDKDGWGAINCYAWSKTKNYTGAWPGASCTYLGNKIWKWTYTGSEVIPADAGLIFNNGGSQTGDFTWVNGGYYTQSGYVKTIPGAGEIITPPTPPTPPVTGDLQVWFQDDSKNWAQAYAYVWSSTNTNLVGAWPGQAMEKTTLNGAPAWTLKFTLDEAMDDLMIIFNAGCDKDKTGDLEFVNKGIYNFSGILSTSTLQMENTSNLQVSVEQGTLVLTAPTEMIASICKIDGTVILRHLMPGRNVVEGLDKGLYIVAGRKIVL